MAHGNRFLPKLFLLLILGISSAWTWNHDHSRVDGYDLGRGPVVYEAYYPDEDSNERPKNDYQEKRYFDHDAVMEKSYQLPSQAQYRSARVEFPKIYETSNLRRIELQPFEPLTGPVASYVARSRNAVESWNPAKDRFDRYPISSRSRNENFADVPPSELQRDSVSTRFFSQVANKFPSFSSMNDLPDNFVQRYSYPQNRNGLEAKKIEDIDRFDLRNSRNYENIQVPRNLQYPTSMDSLPSENIFAPRPQVLNYIFSKSPDERKSGLLLNGAVPRKYGNDLLQLDEKKEEENKENDAKITSIEVSEVPKHKVRHHHGEWLRNFSRFRRT